MTDYPAAADLVLQNVYLCLDNVSASALYDVTCSKGHVMAVNQVVQRDHILGGHQPSHTVTVDAGGGLLLPGLCHAHIHLDKCFLLDRCTLETGDFTEALRVTARAKAHFQQNVDDLLQRGRRLILQSVSSGVTSMRAHVEVDAVVGMTCLRAGLRLREEMKELCHVQITAFAQDSLFDRFGSPHENHALLLEASLVAGVEAIGSAPYVEADTESALKNIRFLFDIACERGVHLDFHLDYNLDLSTEPLIWFVLDQLTARINDGTWKSTQHLCIGHAARLTLWEASEWQKLVRMIEEKRLPVTLVGLPQSDVYMMGRGMSSPPRSTLNIARLAKEHDLKLAMAVNNVGNAFTPQGLPDPLALCPLGVALFQAGTQEDCRILLESITAKACEAIGLSPSRTYQSLGGCRTYTSSSPTRQISRSLVPQIGQRADFVLLHDNDGVQSAACNPCYDRTTIKGGRVVCRRQTTLSFPSNSDFATCPEL